MGQIQGISYYLPEDTLTNAELSTLFDWSDRKIFDKIGIETRHIARDDEYVSDLAEKAALKLFDEYAIERSSIDFILLATQSPDYLLPTTACVLQHRLGLSKHCGAVDFNLGCSAYVYGLAFAKSLIQTEIASNILLIASETYSKHLHPEDKSTRTIFGDGAAATLIGKGSSIGEFTLNTDGSGYDHLIIPASGMKLDASSNDKDRYLYMNGPEIFNFTLRELPEAVKKTLEKNKLKMEDIDLFVFHQANKFILDHLRRILKIPEERFYSNMKETGNTVSATIPIALKLAEIDGRLKKGNTVLLAGFGVGLSWGCVVLTW